MKRVTHMKSQKKKNMKVMYKLKVSKNPASKNMPHEEEFDDDTYESIEEKQLQCEEPCPQFINSLHLIFYM